MTADAARAVVLSSGGLDSTTVLALAHDAGRSIFALSFDYGQRHRAELACARRQAARFDAVAHEVVDLSHMGRLVSSATALVAASEIAVPKGDGDVDIETGTIPSTYVPARNTVFLSYALAWAEVVGATEIWLGVNAVDYSGYPDCRPEFIESFESTANLATRAGVEGTRLSIRAPLIDRAKHEIIARGVALGVAYEDTVSCYDPHEGSDRVYACGRCDSCRLRRAGFEAAGVADPTRYV